MNKKRLSNSEETLLHIFWDNGVPLTSLEILPLSQNYPDASNWSINYIHKMLGMLEEAGYLTVCGFEKSGKRYVRKLTPCISKEEYVANLLAQQSVDTRSFAKIAMALVKKESKETNNQKYDQLITELEQMIDVFEQEDQERDQP